MTLSKIDIPEKSISYLVICAGIIAIICLLGIYPLYRYNFRLAENIKEINYQIKQQNNLMPQYLMLVKNLEKKDSPLLPLPKRTKISREKTGIFQEEFRKTASKSGMMTVSLTPDLTTLTADSPYILNNAVVKGDFMNFRKMLIEIGNIPYLESIDEILIQQYTDATEYKMKLWIDAGK
jgi:hypothetical protein